MELNTYQKQVMQDLSAYLDCVNQEPTLSSAWRAYWQEKGIAVGQGGVPAYRNAIGGVPHVCMKVPTGGGKTFLACAALKRIFDALPSGRPQMVVWLVPSDSILTQTTGNLSNASHPYRQRLNRDFSGCVEVCTKEMLLNGQNFSPDSIRGRLTVCVLSYASLRINSRSQDVRKVYQENGNLFAFAKYFKDDRALLANTPDTALIQVLRHLEPVVIVDESHNAASELSTEMLNNLNPSFVLDLTATPRKNSNIISYVDARDLKREHMVKLPVVVYNRMNTDRVMQDAIQLRNSLEREATAAERACGPYIRPIVLFQAQPKTKEESETFERIEKKLVEWGIPPEEIAIKTAGQDELKHTDLFSRDCRIRYIITVNALKEGWDCPFAYILASLANRTSMVDVEQIVGRILRQPYARQNASQLLNTSYVFTNSADFRTTLEQIVVGLNRAGFSRKDYRVGNVEAEAPTPPEGNQLSLPQWQAKPDTWSFSDQDGGEEPEQVPGAEDGSIAEILQTAAEQADTYSAAYEQAADSGWIGGELGNMLLQYPMQAEFAEEALALRIPQFYRRSTRDLFGGEFVRLEKEHLSEGFSLTKLDTRISFQLAAGEMYRVDVENSGEAVPKYRRADSELSELIRTRLAQLPPEEKLQHCINLICRQIDRSNLYATAEVRGYVQRLVEQMTADELAAMETDYAAYAVKIQEKIKHQEELSREETFCRWVDSSQIVCQGGEQGYCLRKVLQLDKAMDTIPKSLYEAERDDLNDGEHQLINAMVELDNIKWWHRVIERKGFCLNGFLRHYPDFLVMTHRGKLLLIEYKGDDRDNSDSERKLSLGRKWQALAGENYRYFMVFQNRDFEHDGAYTVDRFLEVLREL